MPRTQLNVRVPETTLAQIEELQRLGYESQSHTIIVAIDRLYTQEKVRMSDKIYAISTVNGSATHNAGWKIYGTGATEDEALEDAIDHIGGRDMAKTMIEQTLYANLQYVTESELKKYGLR